MRFDKQTLSGDIVVDGNIFNECQFKDARLIYHGAAPVEFVGVNKFERSTWAVLGAALAGHSFVEYMKSLTGPPATPKKAKPARRKASKRRKH